MSRLFVLLQYLLPRYALTRLVYRVTRIRRPSFKNWLIRRFVALYDVDLEDVARSVPDEFASFNDFFTRELKDDARPIDADSAAIVSPCDGRVSAAGSLADGQLLQAKGRRYGLDELLVLDTDDAARYRDGSFLTVYLAPFDYHRVHAPCDARLTALRYVPGDLFSVNAATADGIPRLFVRNERLVARLETGDGAIFMVLVGALNVGSMTTPWTGEIRPRRHGMVDDLPLPVDGSTDLRRGDLVGWFNMGSTVVLVAPGGVLDGATVGARPGQVLRMGDVVGRTGDAAA